MKKLNVFDSKYKTIRFLTLFTFISGQYLTDILCDAEVLYKKDY